MSKKVVIIGDVHCEWGMLNSFINKQNPDIILQVGDFGWWPHYHNRLGLLSRGKVFDQYGIKNKECKIYWCDGNHENHDDLYNKVSEYGWDNPIEVTNDVFYMPRGSTLTINNKKILFFGGAHSIDKQHRTPGDSWWSREDITIEDTSRLVDQKIDVVISHTCPTYFDLPLTPILDSNMRIFDQIFDMYNPKFWFFGHFHENIPTDKTKFNEYRQCQWKCVDMVYPCREFWYDATRIFY